MRINDSLLVESPELCLARAANDKSIPFVKIVELGCELCGTYQFDAYPAPHLRKRNPLATLQSIEAFLGNSSEIYGSKRLRNALKYILENSASPMETALALHLSLPQRLGGTGLGAPILNQRISLSKKDLAIANKSYYICDLFWPSRLIVEYDSNAWHTGAERIESDAKRRNALEAKGFRVVTVTKNQLASADEMAKIEQTLFRHLGKRQRTTVANYQEKRSRLRSMLLSPWINDQNYWQ